MKIGNNIPQIIFKEILDCIRFSELLTRSIPSMPLHLAVFHFICKYFSMSFSHTTNSTMFFIINVQRPAIPMLRHIGGEMVPAGDLVVFFTKALSLLRVLFRRRQMVCITWSCSLTFYSKNMKKWTSRCMISSSMHILYVLLVKCPVIGLQSRCGGKVIYIVLQ